MLQRTVASEDTTHGRGVQPGRSSAWHTHTAARPQPPGLPASHTLRSQPPILIHRGHRGPLPAGRRELMAPGFWSYGTQFTFELVGTARPWENGLSRSLAHLTRQITTPPVGTGRRKWAAPGQCLGETAVTVVDAPTPASPFSSLQGSGPALGPSFLNFAPRPPLTARALPLPSSSAP